MQKTKKRRAPGSRALARAKHRLLKRLAREPMVREAPSQKMLAENRRHAPKRRITRRTGKALQRFASLRGGISLADALAEAKRLLGGR